MSVRRFWPLLSPLLMLGCSSSESIVSGTVTINDTPLRQGYITFFPVEGMKATQGAEVIDGRYELKQLPVGQRRVVIAETPEVRIVQQKNGPPTIAIVKSSPPLKGNEQIVAIQSGQQTLNFALQKPKSSSAR